MTEPHPLRCKNGCHNLECEYCPDASDHEKRGKPLREKLIIWAFTTKHGCNSFSVHEFPSESNSNTSTEKVLDKLEKDVLNLPFAEGEEIQGWVLDLIADKREELRQERERG